MTPTTSFPYRSEVNRHTFAHLIGENMINFTVKICCVQALPEVKQEETEQATAAPVIVPNLKREADDMPGGDAKRIKEELRKG